MPRFSHIDGKLVPAKPKTFQEIMSVMFFSRCKCRNWAWSPEMVDKGIRYDSAEEPHHPSCDHGEK